jgi:hypothetical protein
MKTLNQLLSKIEAVEQRVGGIAAERKAAHLDRGEAVGALAYMSTCPDALELLKAALAREAAVGEAETAAVAAFDARRARFAACTATSEVRAAYEEFRPGRFQFTPTMHRVFRALKLAT